MPFGGTPRETCASRWRSVALCWFSALPVSRRKTRGVSKASSRAEERVEVATRATPARAEIRKLPLVRPPPQAPLRPPFQLPSPSRFRSSEFTSRAKPESSKPRLCNRGRTQYLTLIGTIDESRNTLLSSALAPVDLQRPAPASRSVSPMIQMALTGIIQDPCGS